MAAFHSLLAGHVNPGASVLDFGGGTGTIASALALRGYRMTVCDISERMLSAGKGLYSQQAIEWLLLPVDWKRLPFPSGSFDAIIASSVFEYLPNVENALAECGRILGSRGKLIFSVPDPTHLSRRLERLLRPPAALVLTIPLVRAFPKIGNYLQYLQVSRVRFSTEEWGRKAAATGFRSVKIEPDITELGLSKDMMYLVFECPA